MLLQIHSILIYILETNNASLYEAIYEERKEGSEKLCKRFST